MKKTFYPQEVTVCVRATDRAGRRRAHQRGRTDPEARANYIVMRWLDRRAGRLGLTLNRPSLTWRVERDAALRCYDLLASGLGFECDDPDVREVLRHTDFPGAMVVVNSLP